MTPTQAWARVGIYAGTFGAQLLAVWLARRFAPSWEWVVTVWLVASSHAIHQIRRHEGRA